MSNIKSWAFDEAKRVLKSIEGREPEEVVFQTGYGPSGLPHIGTFAEVSRTIMVMNAFQEISDIPVKLICFSDDLDGLRKVPKNVPNQELLAKYIDFPLSEVPDPFGKYESFAAYNNNKLNSFLDFFKFKYNFYSSSKHYKQGDFNEILKKILSKHEEIRKIVLPTLGEDRRKTYSPFLPISKKSNKVLQVPIIRTDIEKNTIVYLDEGEEVEQSILDGNVKLQWKVDWAMRWCALKVNYEMSGKDLIDSVKLSSKIAKVLGYKPPVSLSYELFLDKNGEKISKSKGNGLSIEEWLKYAPQESLSYYMYQKPKTAKRLFFDIIPKNMNEYITFLEKAQSQEKPEIYTNPAWHIHSGEVPKEYSPISYSVLINLVSACGTSKTEDLMFFIRRYVGKDLTRNEEVIIESMLKYCQNYYNDFVKPNLSYKEPSEDELEALKVLKEELLAVKEVSAQDLQQAVYNAGKASGYEKVAQWFKVLYQILLGQDSGPKLGSFILLYGVEETIKLIDSKL